MCIYQRRNNYASIDNFSDLVQLYFAFASVVFNNTFLWNIHQNTNNLC